MQAIRHVWSNLGFWLRGEDKRVLTPKTIKKHARTQKPLPGHIIIDMDDEAQLNNIVLASSILEIRNTDFKASYLYAKEIRSHDTEAPTWTTKRKNFSLDTCTTHALALENKGDVTVRNTAVMNKNILIENAQSFTATDNRGMSTVHVNNVDQCTLKNNMHVRTLHIGDKGCRTMHIEKNAKLTDVKNDNPRHTMQAVFHKNPYLKEWHANGTAHQPPTFIRQFDATGASVMVSDDYYVVHQPLPKIISNHKDLDVAGSLDYVRSNIHEAKKKYSFMRNFEILDVTDYPEDIRVFPNDYVSETFREQSRQKAPKP